MISKHEGGFDLHGHSKTADWRRSFDLVNMTPEQIVSEAKKSGLDGVAITDHNSIRGLDRALNAAAKEGIIVVPGVEITAKGDGLLQALGPHILALGINPELIKDAKLPTGQDPETVIKWIHDYGGVAIATHPSENSGSGVFGERLPLPELERLAKQFDAIQTHNIQHGINQEAVRVADEYERPKIGGSDFHIMGQVGIVRTKIFQEVNNWPNLIQAIRDGKTEPFFQQDLPEELVKQQYDRAPIILGSIENKLKTIFS